MTVDALTICLSCAEQFGCVIPGDLVRSWPSDEVRALEQAGILVRESQLRRIRCPVCRGDDREEIVVRAPGEAPQLACRVCGLIEIQPSDCDAWSVSREALARQLRALLAISRGPLDATSNWVWKLGRTKWKLTTRAAVLVCGHPLDPSFDVAKVLSVKSQAIVFVPRNPRVMEPLRDRGLPIVSLTEVVSIKGGELALDGAELVRIISGQEDHRCSLEALVVDELRRAEREQDQKDSPRDKLDKQLVWIFCEAGSFTKAVALATERLGFKVSRSRIVRAVERNGGVQEVLRIWARQGKDRRTSFRNGGNGVLFGDARKSKRNR